MREKEKEGFCSKCNTEIPAAAPGGLCPKCLLMSGASEGEQDLPSDPGGLEEEMATLAVDSELPSGFTNVTAGKASFSKGEPSASDAKGAAEFAPSAAEMEKLFPDLEILDLLGAGGMGAVYKARQKRLDRVIALKILACPPELHDAFSLRFEREAQLLAKLHHPNIVTLFDFGELGEDGPGGLPLFYFIMEYVDGSDLSKRIRAGSLTPDETLLIVPQICDALQVAHDAGITHRDVKPANMLLDSQGQVRVADFGVAKIVDHEDDNMTGLTLTGTTMGTPHYMAPEQWDSPEKVDHRSDIYSLGVIFYQMLTGTRPAVRFQPPSKMVAVDSRIDDIISKALETSRKDRYQQASEMAKDVREVGAIQPVSSGVGKRLGIAMGLCALAVIGAAIWWSMSPDDGAKMSDAVSRTESPPQEGVSPIVSQGRKSKPGKLRAVGTHLNGDPIDLSRAEKYDDFVDVRAESPLWVALRKNGDTISSNGQLDRSGIAKLSRGLGSERGFIANDGSVEISDNNGGLGGEALPESFGAIGVSELALGSKHGVALLRNGQIEAWGPRYEQDLEEGETSPTYETEKWPEPPRPSELQHTIAVAAGATHAAALQSDGSLSVWGHQGVIDPKYFDHIHPIREIGGHGDSFHLLTESKNIYRLHVPRSKHPDSPTGFDIRLEFVGAGEKLESQFYLDLEGKWKSFSLTAEADDLLPEAPAGKGIVISGRTLPHQNAMRSWLFWIEPESNGENGIEVEKLEIPPALAAMKDRGGRLRQWRSGSTDPIDISSAEGIDDFIKLDGSVHPNELRWVARSASGFSVTSLEDFERGDELINLGPHNGVLEDGSLLHCWKSQRKVTRGDLLDAGHSQKVQIELFLHRNGTVSASTSKAGSDRVKNELYAKLATIKDAIAIDCDWGTAAVLRSNGRVVSWDQEHGIVEADPPIEQAVEMATSPGCWAVRRADGAVRLFHKSDGRENMVSAHLTPPEDLGPTFAIRLNGEVCAAQMTDGTWRAWGNDKSGLIEKINQLGPATDILFESGPAAHGEEETLLWIEPVSDPAPHSLALPDPQRSQDSGTVISWIDPDADREFAKIPANLTNVVAIDAHWEETEIRALALHSDGSVSEWGELTDSPPVPKNLRPGVAVIASAGHSAVLHADGTATAWGKFPKVAKQVGAWKDLVAIEQSSYTFLALTSDGRVLFAGSETDAVSPPSDIQGRVKQLSSRGTTAAALLEDGSIRCWGMTKAIDLESLDELKGVEKIIVLKNRLFSLDSQGRLTAHFSHFKFYSPSQEILDLTGISRIESTELNTNPNVFAAYSTSDKRWHFWGGPDWEVPGSLQGFFKADDMVDLSFVDPSTVLAVRKNPGEEKKKNR